MPIRIRIRNFKTGFEKKSARIRNTGLKAYFKCKWGNHLFQEALECYNQALLAAPADPWDGQGEDMALALANR